ncbi:MAG: hypothetical protein WAZ19_01170 [Anaerolineae bacterium]
MSFSVVQGYLTNESKLLRTQFGETYSSDVYEIRISFSTPMMISRFKTDIPVPGLPNLDGILKYAAYYYCATKVAWQYPDFATHCLWQVNDALSGRGWVNFPIPLKPIRVTNSGVGQAKQFFDCSVGLPVNPLNSEVSYPLANEFWDVGGNKMGRSLDSLPLRRRIIDPKQKYRPIKLNSKIDTSRGAYKSLNNRIYNLIVTEYCFYFRGNPSWVEGLLKTLADDGVGIGKKTSLGYGQISAISTPKLASVNATLGHHLSASQKQALRIHEDTPAILLLKNIPTDQLFSYAEKSDKALKRQTNKELFGSEGFGVLSIYPALAGYAPPYWLKRNQTAVAQVGSLLLAE